jgi:hypothetical protein
MLALPREIVHHAFHQLIECLLQLPVMLGVPARQDCAPFVLSSKAVSQVSSSVLCMRQIAILPQAEGFVPHTWCFYHARRPASPAVMRLGRSTRPAEQLEGALKRLQAAI